MFGSIIKSVKSFVQGIRDRVVAIGKAIVARYRKWLASVQVQLLVAAGSLMVVQVGLLMIASKFQSRVTALASRIGLHTTGVVLTDLLFLPVNLWNGIHRRRFSKVPFVRGVFESFVVSFVTAAVIYAVLLWNYSTLGLGLVLATVAWDVTRPLHGIVRRIVRGVRRLFSRKRGPIGSGPIVFGSETPVAPVVPEAPAPVVKMEPVQPRSTRVTGRRASFAKTLRSDLNSSAFNAGAR